MLLGILCNTAYLKVQNAAVFLNHLVDKPLADSLRLWHLGYSVLQRKQQTLFCYVRFDVVTAVKMSVLLFWVIMQCRCCR
jgi:hypothetical protein